MAVLKLDQADRSEIATSFYAELEKGKVNSQNAKKIITDSIFQKFAGKYSINQIKAVASQVTIQLRNKILKPLNLNDEQIHPDRLPFILQQLVGKDLSDVETQKLLAADLQIFPELIPKILDITKEKIYEALHLQNEEKQSVPDQTIEPAALEQLPNSDCDAAKAIEPSEVKIEFSLKGGAWADYERSLIKEKWRQVEADFIDRHVDKDPNQRAKMKILCTPGIKCYLEVRHLLNLGFKPENITAIENEKKAWKDFEANATSLGIRPTFGDLYDVLPTLNQSFDIVSIDFLGGGSDKNQIILEMLPLSERAILAINVLAKRERTEYQESIGRLHKTADTTQPSVARIAVQREVFKLLVEDKARDFGEQVATLTGIANQAFDELEKHLSTDNDMSWDERDTMLWYMQRYAGTLRERAWLCPNLLQKIQIKPERFAEPEKAKKLPPEKLRLMYCAEEFKRLTNTFSTWGLTMLSYFPKDKILTELHMLRDLLNCICTGRRQIIALEKYKYKSKIGKKPSPYCTSLAVTELPKKEYRKFINIAQYGLHFADITSKSKKCPMDVEFDNTGRKGYGGFRSVLRYQEQKVMGLNMQDMLDGLGEYLNLVKKFPLSTWQEQRKVPWQEIETLITDPE